MKTLIHRLVGIILIVLGISSYPIPGVPSTTLIVLGLACLGVRKAQQFIKKITKKKDLK